MIATRGRGVDALIAEAGGPAWDEAALRAPARRTSPARWPSGRWRSSTRSSRVLDAAREVEQRLEPLTAVPLQPARARRRASSSAGSSTPASSTATGAARLGDVERYLRAAARRLERLPDAVAVDRDRMNAVHELERLYRERLTTAARAPDPLRDVPWMLEELRVGQFAQALGVKGGASSKRIRRLLDDAVRPA